MFELARNVREEVKEVAHVIIDQLMKPYTEKVRDRFDGPLRIGKTLSLREDFYSAAYLHWFKIEYITGKPEENEPGEPDKEDGNTKKLELLKRSWAIRTRNVEQNVASSEAKIEQAPVDVAPIKINQELRSWI